MKHRPVRRAMAVASVASALLLCLFSGLAGAADVAPPTKPSYHTRTSTWFWPFCLYKETDDAGKTTRWVTLTFSGGCGALVVSPSSVPNL